MATELSLPPDFAQQIPVPYTPDPRTITWERLETQRLQSLGLSNKYSRHFNVLRTSRDKESPAMASLQRELSMNVGSVDPKSARPQVSARGPSGSNSLAPFATVGKPTCGYFFSRGTDNKKKKFGIPPSDLVSWRNISGPSS